MAPGITRAKECTVGFTMNLHHLGIQLQIQIPILKERRKFRYYGQTVAEERAEGIGGLSEILYYDCCKQSGFLN